MSYVLDGIFSGAMQLAGCITSILDIFGRHLCS